MIVLGDYASRHLNFIIKGKGMERCGEVPLEKRVCDNHVGLYPCPHSIDHRYHPKFGLSLHTYIGL